MSSRESSSNVSMDSGGRLQNHLRAAHFKLCAKSLHIMSLSMSVGMFVDCMTCLYCNKWSWGSKIPLNLGKEMLPNLGMIMFVIHFVRGVSWTPWARSSNPGVDVVALCSCEEKRCSICASNVFISSDIMFCIMTLTFIVPGYTRPSGGGGGNSGVKCRPGVVFLLELDLCAVCCYACLSIAIGVFLGVERGYIRATRLYTMFRIPWG